MVPLDRLRAYEMRDAIHGLFDVGSVLELRSGFGVGMITALARIEGRPVGDRPDGPTGPGERFGHQRRRRPFTASQGAGSAPAGRP